MNRFTISLWTGSLEVPANVKLSTSTSASTDYRQMQASRDNNDLQITQKNYQNTKELDKSMKDIMFAKAVLRLSNLN